MTRPRGGTRIAVSQVIVRVGIRSLGDRRASYLEMRYRLPMQEKGGGVPGLSKDLQAKRQL